MVPFALEIWKNSGVVHINIIGLNNSYFSVLKRVWVCVCSEPGKIDSDICLGKTCAQHIQSECLAIQADGNTCADSFCVHLFIGNDDRTLYFPSVLLIKAL